jgi:chromosome segregation ATPase
LGIKIKSESEEEETSEEKGPKKGGKSDDVSYDKNVITPDEFEELEKKETKKKIKVKKEESSREAPVAPSRHEGGTDVDMLLLKTEKIEGKIESINEARKVLDERLSGINQEIGELRSSIMEKDRIMRDFQKGFAKIKEMSEAMEPEKIASQFAKAEEGIEKNLAQIEALGVQVKQLRTEIKENSKALENIRDIDNLIKVMKSLQEKVTKVGEDRKFTSRTAGKIETMFSDLSEKLGEFQNYKEKIAFNEETMHELMKAVDVVETKMQELVKKDDLKKLEDSLTENVEKVKTMEDDKLHEIRSLLDDLLTSLKEGGMNEVLKKVGRVNLEKMFVTREEIGLIKKSLGKLRNDTGRTAIEKERELVDRPRKKIPEAPARESVSRMEEEAREEDAPPSSESPVMGIKDRIYSLIGQAEDYIRTGSLDEAKNLYREALSLYGQLSRAESYEEAANIYERIRRLYSRLRIYS